MIRRRAVFGLAALAAPAAAQPRPGGALHALLVGINRYRLEPLRGCVNDIELVERSLRRSAASITRLVDGAATRAGFDAAWAEATGRCQRGDTLWFHFSGHGSRMPERIPNSEADGLDDFLVFAPFHFRDAPREILLDNDLEQMMAEQGRRGVNILFAADCCHAGTLTRSVHPSAARLRNTRTVTGSYPVGGLLQALSAGPPPPPSPPASSLTHVHLFAAGQETEEVPEIVYGGRPHGAMSVALATGLSGAVERDANGRIAVRQLAAHALRTVRALAEGRQNPEIEFGSAGPEFLAVVAEDDARTSTGRPVRVVVDGPATGLPAGAVAVSPRDMPDLLWRPASGQLINSLGDLVSADITPALFPAAVEREATLIAVRELVARHTLELRVERLQGGDARSNNAAHRLGTRLRIIGEGLDLPHFVVFNLAGDATVQLLSPLAERRAITPSNRRFAIEDIEVLPPFGADHVIAVAAARPLDELAATLTGLNDSRQPASALRAVLAAIGQGAFQVGLTGLFTRAG